MTLEDHAGDIVAKARGARGVSVGEAAALAGLEVPAYQRFEQTGQGSATLNLGRLAQRLGLAADRLAAIAAGWLPQPRELSRWRELRQITTTDGMAVNCYLTWDPASREAALFDTGWEAQPVFELLGEHELELKHVFVTHAHHDHIAALGTVRRRFPKAEVHPGPFPEAAAGSGYGEAAADGEDGTAVAGPIGSLRVSARPTPGHTEDGTSYLVEGWAGGAPPVVIVGDALFAGSMGRVAGPLFESAKRAVREQILSLPPDTLICPGHGPVTTVGEELGHNPFFA